MQIYVLGNMVYLLHALHIAWWLVYKDKLKCGAEQVAWLKLMHNDDRKSREDESAVT